jgi:hypothetical protein
MIVLYLLEFIAVVFFFNDTATTEIYTRGFAIVSGNVFPTPT